MIFRAEISRRLEPSIKYFPLDTKYFGQCDPNIITLSPKISLDAVFGRQPFRVNLSCDSGNLTVAFQDINQLYCHLANIPGHSRSIYRHSVNQVIYTLSSKEYQDKAMLVWFLADRDRLLRMRQSNVNDIVSDFKITVRHSSDIGF